jgi:hypothetical protein
MIKLKTAFSYKLNIKKVNELFGDSNSKLNGFERHTLQEGLKELLFGNGPIDISVQGSTFSARDLTPTMKHYLLDYEVIELVDKTTSPVVDQETGEINLEYKDRSWPKRIEEGEIKDYLKQCIKGPATEEEYPFRDMFPRNSVGVTIGKPGFEFKNGFEDITFYLDSNFKASMSNINLIANKNIYYEDKLIVEAGKSIPFGYSWEQWEKNLFIHTKVTLMVDLNKFKLDKFDPSKLNCCGHNEKAGPTEFLLTIKND